MYAYMTSSIVCKPRYSGQYSDFHTPMYGSSAIRINKPMGSHMILISLVGLLAMSLLKAFYHIARKYKSSAALDSQALRSAGWRP